MPDGGTGCHDTGLRSAEQSLCGNIYRLDDDPSLDLRRLPR